MEINFGLELFRSFEIGKEIFPKPGKISKWNSDMIKNVHNQNIFFPIFLNIYVSHFQDL